MKVVVLTEKNFENAVKFAQKANCGVDDFINDLLSSLEIDIIPFEQKKHKASKMQMLYKKVKNVLLHERNSHK